MSLFRGAILSGCVLLPAVVRGQSAVVPKNNPMKVYAHIMPWFQTPETLGTNNWGYHWKFNTRNPNIIDSNGQREIASNYYPLIGPYDSTDSNVIEYQMLLMKLSGIDGVIVDWYGQNGTNGDIGSLLTASNDIVNKTSSYGLQFAACLEDRFAGSTSDVSANINYLRQNYFSQSNYIRTGTANSPLMPIFGPITYQQPSQWNSILAASPGEKIDAVPLWYQSQQLGSNAGGEFSWIYEDAGTNDHLTQQQNFLTIQSPALKRANSAATVMGVAYPGFNDYYKQGGTSTVIPFNPIPSNNGQTLASVLATDSADASEMNMLQLATWNDYGEGTMLEPTVQTGFTYLEQIQKFTGVSYGLSQLEMVYQLYEERTAYSGNTTVQTRLNQASALINQLDFADAQVVLNQYQTVTWTGTGTNWSAGGSWSPGTVVATNSLVFAGTNGLNSVNDFAWQTQFDGISFAAGAGAFTLSGNPINLYGDITNNSVVTQTIKLNASMQENANINAAVGDIAMSGILSDGLYGPTALTKLGTHMLTLSGSNTYTGVTAINVGTLMVAAGGSLASTSIVVANGATLDVAGSLSSSTALSVAGNVVFAGNAGNGIATRTLASISVAAGGVVTIARATAFSNRSLMIVSGLSLSGTTNSWQGLVDLGNNDMILHGGNLAMVLNQIKEGYDGGSWSGTGGITSTLAASENALTAIGYNMGGASFDGTPTVTSDILLKYTYYGDANLDGKVDGSDYSRIDNGYLNQLTGWSSGDFNYDGLINGSDYTLIDNTFNSQGAQLTTEVARITDQIAATSVPEPGTAGLLLCALAGLLRRGSYDRLTIN